MAKFMQNIVKMDMSVLSIMNKKIRNRYLDVIMPKITLIGGFIFNISLIILLFFSKSRIIYSLFMSITVSVTSSHLLKRLISRNRPFETIDKIDFLGKEWKDKSFPSAHTAAAFSNAFVLSFYYTNFTILFYLLASSVAISRIYMGVHYPSDIIGGALVGLTVATFFI